MIKHSTFMTRTNGTRLAAGVAAVVVCVAFTVSPALAQSTSSFNDVANTIKSPTCSAFTAARIVLTTAAVLAVIIGLAPMLWGQVKVKWVVSSLVVCVLFTVMPTLISGFAGGVTGCAG